VLKTGITDILSIVNIINIADIADIAIYIADIAMDITDIAMDITDIVNITDIVDHYRYYRSDVVNIVVKTGRRVKGITGVSCNSISLLNLGFCEMGL
jgi:hypothetical protein